MSVLGFDVGGEWVGPGAQDVGGFLPESLSAVQLSSR